MRKNGSLIGLISGAFWGLDSVLLGVILATPLFIALGNNSSFYATLVHDSISFLFLLILIIIMKKFTEFKTVLFSKSGLAIIAAALLGGPIGMGAYVMSMQYIDASLASSFSAVYPIFGMILSGFFLKERIRKHNIIGVVVSTIAIMLMGLQSTLESGNILTGLILVLVCAISWGSEAVIIKAVLKEDVSSEVALSIRQMTTAITYSLVILPIFGLSPLQQILNESSVLLLLVVTGISGTVSYLCYYKAIDLIGPTQAMGLNITYPAWAFVFQYMIDQTFSLKMFLLSLVIIVASILSNDNPKEIFKI